MPLWLAFIITASASVLWLQFNNFLVAKKFVSGKLSRKLIHIGTGPIFVICWMLFPESVFSKYLAAIIPLLISVQFFLIGIGVIKDESSVDALTRNGDRREILKGPLIYGLVFVFVTIVFWRNSIVGITALMILCGGDGLAEVVGRRAKSQKIPWSKTKSIAGSMAMLLGGYLFSVLIAITFNQVYAFKISIGSVLLNLFIVNILTTIVESFPIRDLDNLTVPLTAIVAGILLFG